MQSDSVLANCSIYPEELEEQEDLENNEESLDPSGLAGDLAEGSLSPSVEGEEVEESTTFERPIASMTTARGDLVVPGLPEDDDDK